jgi:hypothetical protein
MAALTKDWPHGYEIVFRDCAAPVTVMCWDKPDDYPIVVYLNRPAGNYGRCAVFQCNESGIGHGFVCLRNAPAPKRSGWVSVWTNDKGVIWTSGPFWSRDEADAPRAANSYRLACIAWREGDGL